MHPNETENQGSDDKKIVIPIVPITDRTVINESIIPPTPNLSDVFITKEIKDKDKQ